MFIHDVILHKLQSLNFGVTQPADDSFDHNAEDIYASKCVQPESGSHTKQWINDLIN